MGMDEKLVEALNDVAKSVQAMPAAEGSADNSSQMQKKLEDKFGKNVQTIAD